MPYGNTSIKHIFYIVFSSVRDISIKIKTIWFYIAKFFKLKSFNAGLEEFIYDYSRVLSEYNREFTHYSLVQAPYPADKKSYPIRWLIVLAAGVVMFFVSYAIFIVLDSNSEKTKKEA